MNDYRLLYSLYICVDEENQGYFESVINSIDPNRSVCPECGVDDFQHIEGCKHQLEIIFDDKLKGLVI